MLGRISDTDKKAERLPFWQSYTYQGCEIALVCLRCTYWDGKRTMFIFRFSMQDMSGKTVVEKNTSRTGRDLAADLCRMPEDVGNPAI